MNTFEWTSNSLEETNDFGRKLAGLLKVGDIVCLLGDLGAGKTTLVKGIAEELGIDRAYVTSPTFVLMNQYEGNLPIYHFDLYRLDQQAQVALIGYDEFLYGDGVSIVEWADRMEDLMPKEYLSISIKHAGQTSRTFNITGLGSRYQDIVKKL